MKINNQYVENVFRVIRDRFPESNLVSIVIDGETLSLSIGNNTLLFNSKADLIGEQCRK